MLRYCWSALTFTASSLPLNQVSDVSRESATTRADEAQIQTDQSALQTTILNRILLIGRLLITTPAVWLFLQTFGAQHFVKQWIHQEATQESAFLRAVRYLQSIQLRLERFKLALDLATPLARLEPTATAQQFWCGQKCDSGKLVS